MTSTGGLSWPYDVKFTTDTGAVYGFMLSQDKYGKKQLTVEESDPPNLLRDIDQFSEVFRQSNPRNDTPYVVTDLSNGVGQLWLDDGESTKYWWSNGLITHVKGKVFPAPPIGTDVATISYNSNASKVIRAKTGDYDFVVLTDRIYRRPSYDDTTDWTLVYTAPGTITDIYAYSGGLIIAAPYTSSATIDFYIQSNPAAAATWSPTSYNHTVYTSTIKPYYFTEIGNTIYASYNNSIYYTTDITADAWVGPITAGPYAVNKLTTLNNFLFAMNPYGIYSVDSQQNVEEVVWQFKEPKVSGFGGAGAFDKFAQFNQFLAFNVKNEVYTYNPFDSETRAIGLSMKDGFSVQNILGLTAGGSFLYILAKVNVPDIYDTDRIALFAGYINDRNEWVFEVLHEDTYTAHHGFSSTVDTETGDLRIYLFSLASSILTTKTLTIPSRWDFTDGDSFRTESILYTSISKSNYPGLDKQQIYVDGNFINLTDTVFNVVHVYYSTDYANTYTLLDIADSSFDTGSHQHFLANYNNVIGETFNFKLKFWSDATTCPIMYDIASHQRIKFRYQPRFIMSIRIADELDLRDRNKIKKKSWEIWDDLKTLRSTTSEILYEDFIGNQYNVTFELLRLTPSRSDNKDTQEMDATVIVTRKDKGD